MHLIEKVFGVACFRDFNYESDSGQNTATTIPSITQLKYQSISKSCPTNKHSCTCRRSYYSIIKQWRFVYPIAHSLFRLNGRAGLACVARARTLLFLYNVRLRIILFTFFFFFSFSQTINVFRLRV